MSTAAATFALADPDHSPQARRLAYAGLAPFGIGTLLIWLVGDRNLDAHAWASLALSAYAGLVVAFLGGIYWGLGFMQQQSAPPHFLWGCVPVFFGWLGVVMPAYAGLVVEGVMLVVCYAVDRRFYPELGAKAWLNLRFRLSCASAFLCFLAAAGC
jgi:hypothetical protein